MCRLIPMFCLGLCLFVAGRCSAQGFVLSGSGPVNRSMGGAGTAAPLDSIGSLQWNPASITRFETSRFDLAVETVFNRNTVESGVGLGTMSEVRGSTSSDAGAAPLPTLGFIMPVEDTDITLGLSLGAVGGFSVNFPADPTNPIFAPPSVGGFGAMYSKLSILQVAPTLAVKVTDRFSVGVAPTFSVAEVQASPFAFTAPNDADSDSTYTYPAGTGSQPTWGLGVQAGVHYQGDDWSAGFSIKSPQWFQSFKINAMNEAGLPLPLETDLTCPMILSWGVAVEPTDRLLLAVDVRYVDYANTKLFGDSAGFAADGSVTGLGWQSVFFTAVGVQFQATDWLSLRAGYSCSQNPVSDAAAMFSVQAPAVYQHLLSLGASCELTSRLTLSCAWVHGFDNSVTGALITPGGTQPASIVRVSQVVDSAVVGMSYTF
ncbi:MAG: TonB-dependent receptor [Planctomycetaceae bacterium]|nr:TonB-dependent receptor [Planctomycetaceae bacterium]